MISSPRRAHLPKDDGTSLSRGGTLAGAVTASASFSSRDCLADNLIPAWYHRLVATGQHDSRFADEVAF